MLILYLIGKSTEVGAHDLSGAEFGGLKTAHDVLERGSDYKVLLLQTQLLPLKELRGSTDRERERGGI